MNNRSIGDAAQHCLKKHLGTSYNVKAKSLTALLKTRQFQSKLSDEEFDFPVGVEAELDAFKTPENLLVLQDPEAEFDCMVKSIQNSPDLELNSKAKLLAFLAVNRAEVIALHKVMSDHGERGQEATEGKQPSLPPSK